MSVAVALDDSLVWSRGLGWSDIENQVPARGNTVYRIASISKTFGTAAVVQLAERGLISLDDPVSLYVPTFPHPVSLRQIMTHTSGIRHYRSGESASMTRFDSLEDAIRIFKDDPLEHAAGTDTLYSSYAFNLLAGVVETVSGSPLEDYLTQEVFQPSGLTATSLEYPERIVPNRSRGYEDRGGAIRNVGYVDLSIKWIGGGMISSAEDLIRFHNGLSKNALVSPENWDLMNSRQALTDGSAIEYTLGWEWSTNGEGERYVGKYGSGAGVSCYLIRVPEEHFALAVLVNIGGRGNIVEYAQRIADAAREVAGLR
jgi:CubicO group peptidase (beta-lactamase class C family)